jgi:tRNA (mo5U34)-methyltransferase
MPDATRLSREELRAAAARDWYHTIELAPGIVTPGWFDHRSIVPKLPFPASLAGMRCLDVATFDGFWAFEMERRGADEVVAIDVLDPRDWDWPAGSETTVADQLARRKEGARGFSVASEAVGSSVSYEESSVYDLDPAEHGEFDFVYLGSLLMHLRDPVRALERVRAVCRGRLLVVDNINLFLTAVLRRSPAAYLDGRGRPWWWKVNLAGLVRMVEVAGFRLAQPPRRVYIPAGAGHPVVPWSRSLLTSQEARGFMLTRLKGDPHAAILADPAPVGP